MREFRRHRFTQVLCAMVLTVAGCGGNDVAGEGLAFAGPASEEPSSEVDSQGLPPRVTLQPAGIEEVVLDVRAPIGNVEAIEQLAFGDGVVLYADGTIIFNRELTGQVSQDRVTEVFGSIEPLLTEPEKAQELMQQVLNGNDDSGAPSMYLVFGGEEVRLSPPGRVVSLDETQERQKRAELYLELIEQTVQQDFWGDLALEPYTPTATLVYAELSRVGDDISTDLHDLPPELVDAIAARVPDYLAGNGRWVCVELSTELAEGVIDLSNHRRIDRGDSELFVAAKRPLPGESCAG